mmetsp:Transcript_35145/g.76947  ORF Transcript_35145/g.76947 Transcript_35145/m.76947 type:complete len:230 (-) Transcript_35145:281-970(-)
MCPLLLLQQLEIVSLVDLYITFQKSNSQIVLGCVENGGAECTLVDNLLPLYLRACAKAPHSHDAGSSWPVRASHQRKTSVLIGHEQTRAHDHRLLRLGVINLKLVQLIAFLIPDPDSKIFCGRSQEFATGAVGKVCDIFVMSLELTCLGGVRGVSPELQQSLSPATGDLLSRRRHSHHRRLRILASITKLPGSCNLHGLRCAVNNQNLACVGCRQLLLRGHKGAQLWGI